MKVCAEAGCPELTEATRCVTHARAKDKARGSRQARGYDAAHEKLRSEYQRRMNSGEQFTCWRCGGVVDPSYWTLGHCDGNRTRYHGPECPPCDYATSGRTSCPHQSHQGTQGSGAKRTS